MSEDPQCRRFQVRLDTALLIASVLCILFAQFVIQRSADSKLADWRNPELLRNPSQLDVHWNRTNSLIGMFNLVAVCAAVYFYKRKGRVGLWIGAGFAGLGTMLAILIDGLFRRFLD